MLHATPQHTRNLRPHTFHQKSKITNQKFSFAVILSLAISSTSLAATPNSFLGPDQGLWSDPNNWSAHLVPNNNLSQTFDVFLADPIGLTTLLDTSNVINDLSIASPDTLSILNAAILLKGGAFANDGTVLFNSTSASPTVVLMADTALSGGGNIVMNSGGSVFTTAYGNTGVIGVRLTSDNSISGQGSLGLADLKFTNSGTITASTGTLTISPVSGASDGFINTGTLRADGGVLVLANATYTNTGGNIEALNGSTIVLNGTVKGGTIAALNNNQIIVGSSTVFVNVTVTGNPILNGTCTFSGTVNFNGPVTLLTGAGGAWLQGASINNSTTIGLTGSFVAVQGPGNASAFTGGGVILMNGEITGNGNSSSALLTSDNTIIGQGLITTLFFTNSGTIVSSGGILTFSPNSMTNTGTIRADGGTIVLSHNFDYGAGTLYDNTNGIIEAVNGSLVTISEKVTAGIIRGNGGTVNFASTSTIIAATLAASNGGILSFSSNSFSGTVPINLVNGGLIAYSTGISSNISGIGTVTIAGSGTTTLSGSNSYGGLTNITNGVLSLGSAGAIASTATISFAGGTLQFSGDNNTDCSPRFSQAPAQSYSIDTNGQVVSFATPLTSVGGTLTKLGAGTLALAAVNTYLGLTTVNVGTLRFDTDNAISGPIVISGSGSILDLNGHAATVGLVTLQAGTILNGTLTSNVGFQFHGGTVTATIINGSIAAINAGTFTQAGSFFNNATVSIGSLGNFIQNGTFSNSGLVSVTNQGYFLQLGNFLNNGMVSIDGGFLVINSFTPWSGGGTLQRANGSVFFAGSLSALDSPFDLGRSDPFFGHTELGHGFSATGVTLTSSSGIPSLWPSPNASAAFFNNVTLATDLRLQPGAVLAVSNSLTLNSNTIYLGGPAGPGTLLFNASASLLGSGSLAFDGSSASTLTLSSSLTIPAGFAIRTLSGSGTIGSVAPQLTLLGQISAETPGRDITVQPALVNSGLVQAINGATVHINRLSSNTGIIQAEPGSTAFLAASASAQNTGTLLADGGTLAFTSGGLTIGGTLQAINGGVLDFSSHGVQMGNGDIHLDGGTLSAASISGDGSDGTFHFNGGTLKASAAAPSFIAGLNAARVEAGGAVIDSNGFNVTMQQPLTSASPAGGLTKIGAGTLTFTTPNTYSGPTTITQGTLKLGSNPVSIAHRWSFNNASLADSVGASPAAIVDVGANNVTTSATQITLAGGAQSASDYVKLGSNLLPNTNTPITIELWATQYTFQSFGRIFDFGSSTNENLFMSWSTFSQNADRVEWRDNGVSTSDSTNAPYTLNTEFHIVMTLNPAGNSTIVTWYSAPAASANLGSAKGTFTSVNTLANFTDIADNLGRSFYGDNTANASYDEVRMWNGALTPDILQTLHAAGPDANLNAVNLGPPAGQLPSTTPLNITASGAVFDLNGIDQAIGSLSGVPGSRVTNSALLPATLTTGADNSSTTFSGSLDGPLTLVKTGSGTFTLAGATSLSTLSVQQNTLRLTGSAKVQNLSINPAATFDLTTGKLILQTTDPADKAAKISQINTAISSGAGALTGPPTWTGTGITSSTAAQDPTHYAVALFDNALLQLTSFGGQPTDTNSILTSIAHLGDASGNGIVDIQDLTILANHWQQPANNWAAGDLNRDNIVDIQDFTIVANNWQQTSSFPLQPSDFILQPSSPVPEPTSLALLFSLIPLLLLRTSLRARLRPHYPPPSQFAVSIPVASAQSIYPHSHQYPRKLA